MLFLSLLCLWINVPCLFESADVQVLQWQVQKIAVLLTFSFIPQQAPYLICMFLYGLRLWETLRETVRFSVPSKQMLSALFMSNYLFTPRAESEWRMNGAADKNSLQFKEIVKIYDSHLIKSSLSFYIFKMYSSVSILFFFCPIH